MFKIVSKFANANVEKVFQIIKFKTKTKKCLAEQQHSDFQQKTQKYCLRKRRYLTLFNRTVLILCVLIKTKVVHLRRQLNHKKT